jgi:hypothetical protein
MSIPSSTRRFRTKAIRSVAAAIITAGVASAGLAASASAAPNDAVNIDTTNHTFQFGNDCLAGVAPTTDGKLNWNENAAHTTVRPHLTGTFCLQNSTAHARVALEFRDNSDALLSRFNSDIMSGSGSALDTMDVDVEGYKVSSALVDHVHVQIQEEDSTGRWVNVPLGAEYLYYP